MKESLGDVVIAAAAEQEWGIAYHGEEIHFWSPITRETAKLPRDWFEDPRREALLRIGTAYLIRYFGLIWPWPVQVPDFPPVE